MTIVHYYLGRPARVWTAANPRRTGNRRPSVTAASGLPLGAAPAGGLLARRRIAIARFGADVAAAGGVGPALAAGLDPAGYPVVPGGVPQAWERARVYLGLCERYQELYQAQVAQLHLLMATMPAPGDPRPAGWVLRDTGAACPLSRRRPLTGPRPRCPPAAEPVQATACPASAGWTRRMH